MKLSYDSYPYLTQRGACVNMKKIYAEALGNAKIHYFYRAPGYTLRIDGYIGLKYKLLTHEKHKTNNERFRHRIPDCLIMRS